MGNYRSVAGLLVAFCIFLPDRTEGDVPNLRSLFSRQADHRLSAVVRKEVANSSTEACAGLCVRETGFQCKSYDFDNGDQACLLYSVSVDDRDVYLIAQAGRDHYKTAYNKLFHRLPNHMLTTRHNRRVDEVGVEECARRCVLETYFKCRGYDFEIVSSTCWLTELTAERAGGVNIIAGWDYYERTPDGPLDNFVNYGFGHMRQLTGSDVYERFVMGVSLEACATVCLAEQTFHCISFDYYFESDARSTCYLSRYIAANVYGLVASYDKRTMHFEKKEEWLVYFYATPYAVVLGNNHKTYSRVTPNRCARMCIEEEAFVCRSFDYKIEDGTCLLSSKTGSDVGGLYNQGLQGVHHFEMKPLLDCGANMTEDTGNFASPNWPRNYAHHEHCTWNITVHKHKVIRFHFSHLDLGLRYQDPCSDKEDRVVVGEPRPDGGKDILCVLPNTNIFTTRTHQAQVEFISNREMDGQGFRVFYTAEWPCNVLLTQAPGEIASAKWPDNYPALSLCSWRISAPEGMRVNLHFTIFLLEQHTLGHCNAQYDHVIILDGGTINAPKIGLYCGEHTPFSVKSSGRDMFVQFKSDITMAREGFHARFEFETQNGTKLDTPAEPPLEEFIPLDVDVKMGYYGLHSGIETAGAHSLGHDKSDGGNDTGASHAYKTLMWAIISSLLLLLLIAGILLYLMWQRTRGRHRQGEEVRGELSAEEVPLHRPPICSSKPNNDGLHGNEIDLSSSACAKDNAYAHLLYGDMRTKENLKNINLDTKC